jgi:hypothetical protein
MRATQPTHDHEWALAVFIIADEFLAPAALADITEMRRVGSSPEVAVAVQIQRAQGQKFERYEIGQTPASTAPSFTPNLAPVTPKGTLPCAKPDDAQTLANFLLWVDEEYKPKQFLVVLWGHSWGLGFGRFDLAGQRIGPIERKPNDGLLHLAELRKALTTFKTRRRVNRNVDVADQQNLDVLATSTCRTSKVEVVVELSETVDYFVGSQIGIPILTGLPFDEILARIKRTDGKIDPPILAEEIVNIYTASFQRNVSLAALNLSRASVIRNRVRVLAEAILRACADPATGAINVVLMQKAFLAASQQIIEAQGGSGEPIVDLVGLCEQLIALRAQAQDALFGAIITAAEQLAEFMATHQFVRKLGGIGNGLDALHGVLTMAPGLTDPETEETKKIPLLAELMVVPEHPDDPKFPDLWASTRWPEVIAEVSPSVSATPVAPVP